MQSELLPIIDIPISDLQEAKWNANVTPPEILARIEQSIHDNGILENLIVRKIDGCYEVISGNHRLKLYKKMGYEKVPCRVVEVDDAKARIIAQQMNRLGGEDDLQKKADIYRFLIESGLDSDDISMYLPESKEKIEAISEMQDNGDKAVNKILNEQESTVMSFNFNKEQAAIVARAIERFKTVEEVDYPNYKSKAIEYFCADYLSGSQHDTN